MKLGFNPLGHGPIPRRLLGAFFLIVAVLAGAGLTVAIQITARSLEARAESQLFNDEAIVTLNFRELEDHVTLYAQLLADAETLTHHPSPTSSARSLMVYLLGRIRREEMHAHLYSEEPPDGDPTFDLVRRGFLGVQATSLVRAPVGDGWGVNVESVAPIETTKGVSRVVGVTFPVTRAYLAGIRRNIGSDITLTFPDGHVISTLSEEDVTALLPHLAHGDAAGGEESSFLLDTDTATGPSKTRGSPFRVNMRREGLLLLTMPMGDLLAAKRTIFLKGLSVTLAILAAASLLYLSLIRRITRPLEHLSEATRGIARGDLDLQVGVTTRDEIGKLAESFNAMVRQLKESRREIEDWNQTLEGRVEERTSSLQKAQTELQGVNAQLVRAMDELRDTQDQMIHTERLAAVGQMASTMAHEIRNPLAGIRAALEVVEPEFRGRGYSVVFKQILDQVDRLGRSTTQLLDFARPSDPRRVSTSVKELVDTTRFLVGQQAERQGIEFRVELEEEDRPISLDPHLTAQAFLNIALNALQAMHDRGSLTIRSRPVADGESLEISFADTGEGMSPEVRAKIFTPFFTTKNQGTGLGLCAAKDIVERQGGAVAVESAEGEGTTVTVRLPVAEPSPSR